MIKISEINIYPIKSCKGTTLKKGRVTGRGLEFDRQWLIVDSEGQFLTQRSNPLLAKIHPQITNGSITDSPKSGNPNEVSIQLSAPGMPPLVWQSNGEGEERRVQVWSSKCRAVDEGDEVAAWLRTCLRAECRLVRFSDSFVRPVNGRYAKHKDDQVGFADGFPFLLISEGSLEDLNAKLPKPVPMNRFRPNIVVTGCSAFAEDDWTEFQVGGLRFYVVKPCDRCVITCTDQDTGEVSPEPLRTLAKYRTKSNKVLFGQNLVHHGEGEVRVGDSIELLH
jgi:uncharacterized protein YcbX